MSEMNPQRRKVVVMAASIACLSGSGPLLLRSHPRFLLVWTGIIIIGLIFTMVEFVKLKKQGQ